MATNPDRSSYFPAIEKKYGQPMSYWFEQMERVSGEKYPDQIAFLRENYGFSQAHANALVMYCRGSKTAHRVTTVDEYLAPFDETKQKTVRAILNAITSKYRKAETVIAWNQPMVRLDGQSASTGIEFVFNAPVYRLRGRLQHRANHHHY